METKKIITLLPPRQKRKISSLPRTAHTRKPTLFGKASAPPRVHTHRAPTSPSTPFTLHTHTRLTDTHKAKNGPVTTSVPISVTCFLYRPGPPHHSAGPLLSPAQAPTHTHTWKMLSALPTSPRRKFLRVGHPSRGTNGSVHCGSSGTVFLPRASESRTQSPWSNRPSQIIGGPVVISQHCLRPG